MTRSRASRRTWIVDPSRPPALALIALAFVMGCQSVGGPAGVPEELVPRLIALASPEALVPRPDATNRFADDPRAASLGQRLFFDRRFSGPLLDHDNTGLSGTLGMRGETQRVSCADCHVADSGFVDTRSTRGQISLASSWTRRRTPTVLDLGRRTLLMWDGRFDTAYQQPIGVIDSPIEFNSSRLFVAQQFLAAYASEYVDLFGAPPSIAAYGPMAPEDAGCAELEIDPVHQRCPGPGHDDPAVIEILMNMGRAIAAYERLVTCGPSRFDRWFAGDDAALTDDERAGALVFLSAGCDQCHSGPDLTDDRFHNVGAANLRVTFIEPFLDPGAAVGLAAMLEDPLGSLGVYSDGDDGRRDALPSDLESLRGAFRTPSLRCISRRPSYFHAGQFRSLEDVVLFFDRGGDTDGFEGVKDEAMVPLGLTSDERRQLTAFLRALEGEGPDPRLLGPPS